MTSFIHVQPAADMRRPFAVWATAQDPKVRTCSSVSFAVPAALFVEMPEDLLIGSLVDGHQYVSPNEEPPPGFGLVGEHGPETVVPMRKAVPGQVLPEVPAEAYGPDSVPLAPEDVPTKEEPRAADAPVEDTVSGYRCPDCARPYATERGMTKHRARAHGG
jgi:hypothetical protein